jgi:hypothetical protein
MKSYTAWCTSYEGEKMSMTRECESKKEFAHLLHDNGYKVSFIALTEKYDEESEKYNARRIQKNREAKIRRDLEKQWRERDKKFAEELEKRLAAEEETAEETTTEEPAQEAQTMKKHFFYLADIDTTFTVAPMTKKEIISIGQELKELCEFMSDDQTISGYTKDGRFFYYDNANFDSFKKSDIINAVSVIYSDESGDYYWGGFDINEWGVANPTEDGAIIIADHDNIKEVENADYSETTEETAEEPATEKPTENPTDSAFIAEMVEALKYFKRVLWSYIDGTRYERDISGDFWGAHECSVILRFVNDRLKAQGAEPYYKLNNDFDSLTECFEEIMQKFEYGDERTIEEIISEYNFS